MSEFIKSSFSNGNRYTNITVTLILLLIAIISFFLKDIFADYKEMHRELNEIITNEKILENKFENHINNNNIHFNNQYRQQNEKHN